MDAPTVALASEGLEVERGYEEFDVIEMPAPGWAEAVEGHVEFLVDFGRWRPVGTGTLFGHGTRLRIARCAKLVVRFSETEHMVFLPAPFARSVALTVVGNN